MSHRIKSYEPLTIEDARKAGMRDPVTVIDAARFLRLRYPVALRLVKGGRLKGRQLGARFFVERGDLNRALREKPWRPWVMRKFKNSHGHTNRGPVATSRRKPRSR